MVRRRVLTAIAAALSAGLVATGDRGDRGRLGPVDRVELEYLGIQVADAASSVGGPTSSTIFQLGSGGAGRWGARLSSSTKLIADLFHQLDVFIREVGLFDDPVSHARLLDSAPLIGVHLACSARSTSRQCAMIKRTRFSDSVSLRRFRFIGGVSKPAARRSVSRRQ